MSEDAFPPPPPPPADPPMTPGGAEETHGPMLPWEERDRLGFVDALIETVKLIFTAPSDAFSRLRADGDLIWPLVFGLVFSWIGQFFNQIWNLLLGGAMQSMIGGLGDIEGFAMFGATSFFQMVGTLVVWPVFYVIIIFISAGIFHLCLMLVGATNESPTGFEGTLKVLAYAQVANLAAVIPLLGGIVAAIVSLVLLVLGFTQVHRTDQSKALIAVLIPVTLCCICCIVGIVMFGASLAALMSQAG